MSDTGSVTGVLAGVGPARRLDLAAFADCGLNLIRLRSLVNLTVDVAKWRDAGASLVVLQLLSPRGAQSPLSPEAFVEYFSSDLEAFLATGVRDIEIHDEPNRPDRGAGVSWRDGAAFGIWFEEVLRRLRARFGDDLRLGFPGLAPTGVPRPTPSALIDAPTFLSQCRPAVELADWVALHVYWRTLEEMRALDGAMGCLRDYLEAFETQNFIITEFANVNPELAADVRGRQYAEFTTLMAQYDRILGTSGFLLRSSDPRYSPLAWLKPEGTPPAVLSALADRPQLPDPRQVWFAWPTEVHRYTQAFGANQCGYFDSSGMTGGHNGVDLAVDVTSPETSPITAAMAGTVTQVALDEVGYGHHVRVRSYGPRGEEITLLYAHLSIIEVTTGTLVGRGDQLGWAGSTGACAGPHLHLGMRVSGVVLPQVCDTLNARPYLDSSPRGWPREPYARTYVLLPPDADTCWAEAVVEACWDDHRFTLGGSADDAGIGALELRRVVAVNLDRWGADLVAFFETHYPDILIISMTAKTPQELVAVLVTLPSMPNPSPAAFFCRTSGLPREPYRRTYVLLPPDADKVWALAAVRATWDTHRFTIGGSADDAGIGDLDDRCVIVINPHSWSGDVTAFFDTHYPGARVLPMSADTPEQLGRLLSGLSR
ncbi:MAG: M23 family metallopeptidase [Anaerolineae bacterium]|nr:M23 family metallopeptidase [Anaerolineae bacterium]